MSDTIKLTINGKACTGTAGQTILDVAEANGIEIPNLCHNGELKHYGGCSLCVVEVEGRPKLMRACSSDAADGMVVKSESERVVNSRKIAMEFLMSDHDGDCMGPCSLKCPSNVDAHRYVQAIAKGDDLKAVQIIKNDLPLPASIGRVCPHPCEEACRRQNVEEPISIAFLKYAAADRVLANGGWIPKKANATGKKVGIIGGGPAGLTAAYYLALAGHDVTIVDAMPKMGGMLRYGIPEYRLPKAVLDAEIAEIASLGIKMENNKKLGVDFQLNDFRTQFDATIVAVGAWKSLPLRVEGEQTGGILGGITFLEDVAQNKDTNLGKKVMIVGGGNTAMDACRTAVREGAEEVYVVYRRTEAEMPAAVDEIADAKEEDVQFKFLRNPAEIISTDGHVTSVKLQVMELGEPDESGRRRPVAVEGEFETVEVDNVIAAIGQKVDITPFDMLVTNARSIIAADEKTYRTSADGVFGVGDCTNKGAGIAIEAIGEGKRCAKVVDFYLHGVDMPFKAPYVSKREPDASEYEQYASVPRAKMPMRPAEERKHDYKEAALGFSEEQMRAEAQRCLDCGCHDYYDCKLIKCANLYEIHPERLGGSMHPSFKETELVAIERNQGKCILCGQCVRMCDEVVGKGIIGLMKRGFSTDIEPVVKGIDVKTVCAGCLKCAQACPTGALRVIEA